MNKTDGNVTEITFHGHNVAALTGHTPCWICQSNLSPRAAFCEECGTIQPVRQQADHFTRLGLERRYDVDQAQLEGRYLAISRIFQSERLIAKGPRQKQLAFEHSKAAEEAHTTLRDPVRRAQYMLAIMQEPLPETLQDSALAELRAELETAADSAAIDRVAFKAGHGVELAVRELSASFRQNDYPAAAQALARLQQYETLVAEARARRHAAA